MVIVAPFIGVPSGGEGCVAAGNPPGAQPGVLQSTMVIWGGPCVDPMFLKSHTRGVDLVCCGPRVKGLVDLIYLVARRVSGD